MSWLVSSVAVNIGVDVSEKDRFLNVAIPGNVPNLLCSACLHELSQESRS